MIVEFALTLSLSVSPPNATVVPVEFRDPIREVITYPPFGLLNQLSGLSMPDGTREAYETEFLPESVYFGAFAVTKDFGYGYVTGANSLDAAREIALQECLKHGPSCLIYAEIIPQGYVPIIDGQVTLAREAAELYSNPDPSWGQARAMAVSEDGAYALVWGYANPNAARDAAMVDCETNTITDLPNLRPMSCMVIPFK